MVEIYHINFHTVRNLPIFLNPEYAASLGEIISDIIREHELVCHISTVMPNHVHLVLTTFPDQSRAQIVQLVKGGSARAFFARYPLLREEIGAHLWQEGFDWVIVDSHRQFRNAIRYVQENRGKIGLEG